MWQSRQTNLVMQPDSGPTQLSGQNSHGRAMNTNARISKSFVQSIGNYATGAYKWPPKCPETLRFSEKVSIYTMWCLACFNSGLKPADPTERQRKSDEIPQRKRLNGVPRLSYPWIRPGSNTDGKEGALWRPSEYVQLYQEGWTSQARYISSQPVPQALQLLCMWSFETEDL